MGAVESYYAPDCEFNRANAPTMIGRHFAPGRQPSYTKLQSSYLPPVEYLLAELDVITAVAVSTLRRLVK